MASYLTGETSYIPELQPYQPDLNFLNNVLQIKQSQYDQNYKQLSKTYGTLLNSEMLRSDNIEQRNEFFKLIDDDIKRISSMDLSMQQNVDQANRVFESFYQNKNMVHDMLYTKEYRKQLEIADNYRNCIDQEECGGKYSDEMVNALHYKAEEFKKASRDESLSMQPGRFTPAINMQEKVTTLTNKLLKGNSKGQGAFGIKNARFQDGYIVYTENGIDLQAPLQQLLLNQLSKDQNVIDYYNTKSYVNRKGYIAQNLEKFQGNEDAAEDEYFNLIDTQIQESVKEAQEALENYKQANARKKVNAKHVEQNGVRPDDPYAALFAASAVDDASADDANKFFDNKAKTAISIFEAGDNRQMKRQRVQNFIAQSLMTKDIKNSATAAAAMTGGITKIEADPYKMEYYKNSLEMSKIKMTYDLMDRNNQRQAVYDIMKKEAEMEYKVRGSATGPENDPTFVEGVPGTSSGPDKDNENTEIRNYITNQTITAQKTSEQFVKSYALQLQSIVGDPNADPHEKELAKGSLTKIFGKADNSNNYGYDPVTNTFKDPKGNKSSDPSILTGVSFWRDVFGRARTEANMNQGSALQKSFLAGNGKNLLKTYDRQSELITASTALWQENNLNVKKWGETNLDKEYLADWKAIYFTPEGRLKTKEQYTNDYIKFYGKSTTKNARQLIDDAGESYDALSEKYSKYYNDGNTIGTDAQGKRVPLVKALAGNSELGLLGGGKSAGGGVLFEYNSRALASDGTKGVISFSNDAASPDALYGTGIAATAGDLDKQDGKEAMDAKAAFNALIGELKQGNFTKAEKDDIIGQVMYMDLALSDPNKVAINVKIPEAILAKYRQSEKAVTWADNSRFATEGVTVYVNKNSARNSFTERFKLKPYDMILNHQSKVIDDPYAGKITINKRGNDGSILVNGFFYGYEKGPDGKTYRRSKEFSMPYTNNPSGQKLYEHFDVTMGELAKRNQAFINNDPNAKVYDINQLIRMMPEIAPDMPDQQPSMTDLFLQKLQTNFSQR